MTAQDALNLFARKAEAGEVANAHGEPGPISPATRHAIESTVRSVFRFAAGKEDLAQIEYEPFADQLPHFALLEAEQHGLRDGPNRASRCRRFVRTVDGKVYQRRRSGIHTVLRPWRELYGVLLGYEHQRFGRAHNATFLARLSQHVQVRGIQRPEDLPDRNVLHEWIVSQDGIPRRVFDQMLSAYRRARQLYEEQCGTGRYPDVDRCPIKGERGIRGLPDIVERLEAKGYHGPVSAIAVEDAIRLLAPRFYRALAAYIASHERRRGRGWRKKVVGMASRYLAAYAQSGLGDLETAHPTVFLLQQIDTGERLSDTGDDEWAEEFLHDLGLAAEDDSTIQTRRVPLFEWLAFQMAVDSARNSPLTVLDEDAGDAVDFWTETVISDVRLIGQLGIHAGQGSRLFRQRPSLAADAATAVRECLRTMRRSNAEKRFARRKAKEKLLGLITYPQVICLGLPALRREVLRLREEWWRALLDHAENPAHPTVARAEAAYDRALTDYCITAVFFADGLRLANYTNARLGSLGRERMVRSVTSQGVEVRSYCHIFPMYNDAGDGLVEVRTSFYGDDHAEVKLKIEKVSGSDEWRERPHWLRPGIVDLDLLWDYLTRVRPKNLAAQGLIPAVEDYDLQRDVTDWHFALFVSPVKSERPYAAVTGAYRDSTISEIVGRTLHWMCVHALGRDLPPFPSKELRRKYPRVFSAHVTRLLIGTYLFGVRGRRLEAQTLLDDTERTVERRYSVIGAGMVHRRGGEHPNYFDQWFDRIWDRQEVIDWESEGPLIDRPGEEPTVCRVA